MKSELRGKYLKKRMEYKNPLSDMIIYNKVIRGIHKYDKVLIYVSKENEVDTINIIKYCLHNNIKVAVPKCNNNEMLFYYIDSLDELSLNKYNILEPNNKRLVRSYKNSICITPSILLDNKGNRIGYGGGYYDRFFTKYDGCKLGIIYKECMVDELSLDSHDIKLDYIITD
ncbi:MAG: 5-formyltetrahydrofolate cyclo-ligase [Bacillales bacterium]|nr:5-formyltetrahydrofolate cyclo-ligase [Bacillales bacterium]